MEILKEQALLWANSFDTCCVLDSNGYADPYGKYDLLIAAGAREILEVSKENAFEALKAFHVQHQTHLFGYLSYDLKNQIEALHSENPDNLQFPLVYFFVPEYLIAVKSGKATVLLGHEKILTEISAIVRKESENITAVQISPRIDRAEYLKTVQKLRQHIQRGDIYEVNFCQEFFSAHAEIDPVAVFTELNKISPTPFSGYFKIKDHYILSATPERFLTKQGNKLVSQPIKGTARRSNDTSADAQIKATLRNNPKELAENVMIVDLVRHDLTKSAVKGTVNVEELFGVYSFKQVHQLISTVSCSLDPNLHFTDALRNTFPMGSMTGAPKVKAMQLIEQYEQTKRGVYSGCFGWISPEGDFDFNVVIRTLLYDASKKYLSFHVGGAITYASDPEKEYEECMVKASAMIEVLGSK